MIASENEALQSLYENFIRDMLHNFEKINLQIGNRND